MSINSQVYIGIDVSKDKLDVVIWDDKSCLEVASSKQEITKLVRRMLAVKPKVMEATEGYEEGVELV
jgi:transposase